MKYNAMFILVEGLDDERFCKDVIMPKIQSKYEHVACSAYSGWKPEKPHNEIACIAYIIDEIAGKKKVQAAGPAAGEYPTPWQSLGQWRR